MLYHGALASETASLSHMDAVMLKQGCGMCPPQDENQSGDEGKKTQGAATNKEPQNESRREVANSLPAVTAVKGSACCVIF